MDRSHTAHHLQTQLTSAQEIMVVHLRRTFASYRLMICWPSRASFCALLSRARGWIGVRTTMAWEISMP